MEQKRFDFLNFERRSTFPQNSHFSSSPFGPGGSGTSSRSEASFFSVTETKISHKGQIMAKVSCNKPQRINTVNTHTLSCILPHGNPNQFTSLKFITYQLSLAFHEVSILQISS
jgi:hypothetical protein